MQEVALILVLLIGPRGAGKVALIGMEHLSQAGDPEAPNFLFGHRFQTLLNHKVRQEVPTIMNLNILFRYIPTSFKGASPANASSRCPGEVSPRLTWDASVGAGGMPDGGTCAELG